MAVNKVVINTEQGEKTLVDLTQDTVTPETLAEGATAHAASGEMIEGTMPTTTVLYTKQTLTDAQQEQARGNIGAASAAEVGRLSEKIGDKLDASALPTAIDDALAQAKESGEFDGKDGEPGLRWCGEWSDNTDYIKNDAVSRNGTSYILRTDMFPSGGEPENYPDDWDVLAQKGDAGVQGPAYTLSAADKAAITAAVIEGLPVYAGEVV